MAWPHTVKHAKQPDHLAALGVLSELRDSTAVKRSAQAERAVVCCKQRANAYEAGHGSWGMRGSDPRSSCRVRGLALQPR